MQAPSRRSLLAAGLAAASRPALAQPAAGFPNRPVRLVVPAAPGGSADIVARILAQGMTERLGQQVVIENRAGAGGLVASEFVANAPPDGHILAFFTLSAAVLNDALQERPPIDIRRALKPVSIVGTLPQLIVVNPSVPARTLRDLMDLMRSRPGRVTYASSGPGTILHLGGHMLAMQAGATAEHIPYRGAGPALSDVVAGNVNFMVEGFPSLLPFIRTGQLRALALAAPTRNANLPDLPTTDEAGLPGFHVANWHAVFAPAATPPAVMTQLETAVREAMAVPAVRTRLTETGLDLVGSTAAEAATFWDEQFRLWVPVVRASGAKAE
ncbi:Bug family tripartite tricarboxylate transporter substrate binding protein [Muricoccus radiodurans]|uniref:Bug family tripartite tricarboxylate transporter substrate binding protein n=1 Tax=Muricoccus radiodurans TaxID=2231721 RepID=UPI003CF731B1